MKKKKDIQKIIKENPAVDKELFEKSRKAIEELRRIGIKDSQYNLIPPFTITTNRKFPKKPKDDK